MASDNEKKGFAGLDSMISDVELPKPPREAAARRSERNLPPPITPSPGPQQIYQGKPESSGGSAWKWWAIGIAVVGFFIWIGNLENKTPDQTPSDADPAPVTAPADYASAPAYTPDQDALDQAYSDQQRPVNEPAPVNAPPEPAPAYASNEEEMPPIGNGLVLSSAQIRYCLSEKIRISAWQGVVNQYSETSVNAFNNAVNNYNIRCSNFRYRSGMLESVRAEVEANRNDLVIQGIAKANSNP